MAVDPSARPGRDLHRLFVPIGVAAFILAAGILTAVLIRPSHRQVCTRQYHPESQSVSVACTDARNNRLPLRIGVVLGAALLALFEVAFEVRAARRHTEPPPPAEA
jgi:hypothetical protein